jgi:hypothetical protein
MPYAKSTRELQIIDPVLTEVARRFTPKGMIYNQLAPSIAVTTLAGQYPVFTTGEWFGDEVDNKVADRGPTPEVDFSWSTESYLCQDYRLKATITREERRQANSALRLDQNKTEFLLTRMAMRRERRLVAKLKATGDGGSLTGGSATPSNLWDTSSGDPENDIKTGKLAVYNKTGMVPNCIVLPYNVAAALSINTKIREILKYTVNGGQILSSGETILPDTLWGMKVMVPSGALYNSAKEGGTTSLNEVWGKDVRLLYVAENAGWGIPSVAYSFKAQPEQVDRWVDTDPPVENIRAWECVDEKVTAPDLGYVIKGCIS